MARLFGMIGNRADLAGRVLAAEPEALRVRSRGGPLGWGMGFYQGGEVLMRRRPIDDRHEIDVATVGGDIRADVLIGHVRTATVGTLRTENTHPFRYRQWLFAETGTIPGFESLRERLTTSVPEFLRGNIRGETDSEVMFHVFLSFLHDSGRIHDLVVEAAVVQDALRSTVAVIDGMTAEIGGEPAAVNMLVTNGDYVVGVHRAATMAIRQFAGKNDADALIGDDLQLRRRAPELAQMRFALLASDFDDDPGAVSTPDLSAGTRWKKVQGRAIVTLTRDDDPKIEAL